MKVRSPSSRLRRAAAARAARVGDELVLLHLESGHYFTLNETGAAIWDRIGDGATLGELRDALVEAFEVDAETAWADVVGLVDELIAERLVELAEAPA